MSVILYIGVALTLVGLAGIVWFIHRARRLKRSRADDKAVQAELRSLVFLNIAAFGLAFLGLAVTVVALILAA